MWWNRKQRDKIEKSQTEEIIVAKLHQIKADEIIQDVLDREDKIEEVTTQLEKRIVKNNFGPALERALAKASHG